MAVAPLPPEPWGSKFHRAREDVGGFKSLELAAAEISHYKLCTATTLSRLERRADHPSTRSARATAYIACLIYGVDPVELDLDPDDVPDQLLQVLRRRRRPKIGWSTGDDLPLCDVA